MKTEEFTQAQLNAEELSFDEHEFDGLRREFAGAADTWLGKIDQFVRENPWMCIGIAAAAGCAIAYAISAQSRSSEETAAHE